MIARVEALCGAESLVLRLDALESLVVWLTMRDKSIPVPLGVPTTDPLWRRLLVFLSWLETDATTRGALAQAVRAIVIETRGIELFAEAGLPNDRGLTQETADRLFRRILPSPRDEHDLGKLVGRLFPSKESVDWLEDMPADIFQRMAEAVIPPGTEALLGAASEALVLLGARVQALGLSKEIRARGKRGPLPSSPFHRLPRAVDVFTDQAHPAPRLAAQRDFHDAAAGCREDVAGVLTNLEQTGISLDVVYGLEVIEQTLVRMEHLLALLAAAPGLERATAAHRLLAVLARARLSDRSLRDLARTNLQLLARKIIERAGSTGEHYITYGRRDYWQMVRSAAGGGLLTTATAALKVAIAAGHFALFVEGFLSGLNYAISFMLLQLFGFTLATKQPSMTAAQLAGAIRDKSGPERTKELVAHVASICRSQVAAAMGNICMVTVGALLLDLFWRWRTGHAFLPEAKSVSVVASFHVLESGTAWYAAVTGVILWASSLAAGWVENFAVYRRLPQAIAEHRMGRIFGRRTMEWMSGAFARNVSGLGGSIALGFMLGMTPVFGQFLGVPLDVRHVTLSTGTLALSAFAVGVGNMSTAYLWALGGIATMFVLNLGVSFNLALAIALRARAVNSHDRMELASALLRRFLRHPGEFLLPPRSDAQAPSHQH